jgi:hypothetical protein
MIDVAWFIRFIYCPQMASKEPIFVEQLSRATKIGFDFLK